MPVPHLPILILTLVLAGMLPAQAPSGYPDGQVAYVPTYGLPELDEAALATYRRLGFRVHPIDVSRIAPLGGTVRCLTNVLRWSLPAAPLPKTAGPPIVAPPPSPVNR